MYYVYVLVDAEGHRYTGYTSNLKRRFAQHNSGGTRWNLAYYEAYADKADAMRRETRLKDGRAKAHLFARASNSLRSFEGLK